MNYIHIAKLKGIKISFQPNDITPPGGGILGFIFQISDFSFKNGRGVYGEEMWMRGGKERLIYIY
jgi:hypothetical protein